MPFSPPPVRPREDPHPWVLRDATVLWRVHRRRHPSTEFNSTRVDRYFGPSRFSGTQDDPYPYFYAAFTGPTALAEALLRGIPDPLRPAAIPPIDLDDGAGAKWLNDELEPYGVRIRWPRAPRW